MRKISISMCAILLLCCGIMFSQNLENDINLVSQVYQSSENLSIEWLNYLTSEKDAPEHLFMYKCKDDYYIKGLGQEVCINGKKQIAIYPDRKIAIYSEADEKNSNPDPLFFIKDVLQSANSITYKPAGKLKYYKVDSNLPSIGTLEIWIAQNPLRINKVVQHLKDDNIEGFVFELVSFKSECTGGIELQLSHYISQPNGTISLKPPYNEYKFYNSKDYALKQ